MPFPGPAGPAGLPGQQGTSHLEKTQAPSEAGLGACALVQGTGMRFRKGGKGATSSDPVHISGRISLLGTTGFSLCGPWLRLNSVIVIALW